MNRKETRRQRIAHVAQELHGVIRGQARDRWSQVRVAERNEPGRHVWRFRTEPGGDERFLHIEHRAMVQGADPAGLLARQLSSSRWAERLEEGPGTAVLLSRDGELAAFPDA